MGEELSLAWTLPFVGMLLSIALFPLFAPHFWHHHFRKIAIGWAALLAVPFLLAFRGQAVHDILHILLVDYVPFLILLGSLFTISGGILVRGTMVGTPMLNAGLIFVGTVIASWVGTTGASMLLIRPLLRANERRRHKVHTVVFFIFLVSNIGGCLTPLGDPPLFLGFLHRVPFFWTLTHLWPQFLVATAILMALYLVIEFYFYSKEPPLAESEAPVEREPLRIEGLFNFVLLAGVIGGVLLSGSWKPTHLELGNLIHDGQLVVLPAPDGHADDEGDSAALPPLEKEADPRDGHDDHAAHAEHGHGHHGLSVPLENIARDAILVVMALVSMALTSREIRQANGFSWFPILEVAWLFFGIFVTIIPALQILQAGEKGALASLMAFVRTPAHYFWVSGILSSFLDNAPTYLTFFNTALGRFFPGLPEAEAVPLLIAQQNDYLVAISVGSVFMGANTYIGNAPNFMVKSIAEESGVRMPDFFRYIFLYSLPILGTTFVFISFIFFRG